MASPVTLCYDQPNVHWKGQKQWTAYGRWLKTTVMYWERQPAQYIRHVMRRVDRDGGLTCDERMSIVRKLARKYSGNPLASIKPYEDYHCKCKLSRCNKPIYVSEKERNKAKDSSKEAIEFARTNKVLHSVLPDFRRNYPVCSVCNAIAVDDQYKVCKSKSCRLLSRMHGNGHLIDKKKAELVRSLRDGNQREYIEICYLVAVLDRFLSNKRPKGLEQFFKRYKGFENVTKQN
jgi:hypothetical protein